MEENKNKSETLKLLCSYNGVILPPRLDGAKLRYSGGHTRVLSVDRSVSHAELMVKIGEFCGFSATLRCQLPGGDLDTLVTIASDEDLANLIEEYDRVSSSSQSKIRAVLFPRKPIKTVSPPQSVVDFGRRAIPPPSSRRLVPFRGRSPARLPVTGARFYSPFLVEERSSRVSDHQFHNHHHHHHQQYQPREIIPRSYYWQ